MVTVLFVTTAVMLLAITFSIVATSERRSTASSAETEIAIQLADAGTERARRTVIEAFNGTFLSIGNFLVQVAAGNVPALAGVNTVDVDGRQVHWQVIGVSDPGSTYGWIDVAATADVGGSASQTVIRRIGFGASSTFNLAMLSETTDCMFCHLRVNGDVGNLIFMRPGWGSETSGGGSPSQCSGGNGRGSGGNPAGLGMSRINGNVFAAQDVTNDCTTGNRLNGAEVSGVIERFSTNASLPTDLDGDGIADFPPIAREIAIENALGTIGGGAHSCVIPIGGTFGGLASCGTGSYNGQVNGNLVLIGTQANPINIDGDFWVEGDVIISGYVQGLGGLYAGRNVYIAGDVQSVSPPYRVNSSGNCVREDGTTVLTAAQLAATGFSANDACARRSIEDNTDALRIAARGSIIIGDYAERDASGQLLPYSKRQSADFYRAQFGFDQNEQRWYDIRNGDELRRNSANQYVNADGVVVSTANRRQLPSYTASFHPGSINAAGFHPWMTETQYHEILGTEVFDHNTWRWSFNSTDWTNGTNLANMMDSLMRSGLSYEGARAVVNRKVNFNNYNSTQWTAFRNRMTALGYTLPAGHTTSSGFNISGTGDGRIQTTDDNGNRADFHWSGNDLRVIFTGNREYETQVNRIDAFLYANQRIAGKTSMQAMSITGGLVARDLGILAPGRALENWVFGNTFPAINNNKATACSNPSSQYYVYGSEDCALTVNYDHRLRNGGYGYNIIEGRIGITLDWRVAASREYRVTPP